MTSLVDAPRAKEDVTCDSFNEERYSSNDAQLQPDFL